MVIHDASGPSVARKTGARRFELDWLRTIVVLGLIPYHAIVVFAVGPGDYVKASQGSLGFDLAATVVAFWGMPLLFLVAGAATWFALRVRSPRRYLAERAGRLAVPFVLGVLALVPVQLYFERLATPGYHQNYGDFYREFLVNWVHIFQRGVFGLGFQYWGHLWFVLYLLAVSVFLLPLLMWLRGAQGSRAVVWVASRSRGPAGILLFGAVFTVIEVALRGPVGDRAFADYNNLYSGAAGLVLYAAAFVIGFVLFADARFQSAAVEYRRLALIQAVGLLVVHMVVLAPFGQQLAGTPLGALAIRALRAYDTWCWLVALLGYALRYLTAGPPALRYLNEACFPVYVLHMPVLTVLGFYMVRWSVPIVAQFALLMLATGVITFALYEGLVRRFPPMRFLFGLKPRAGG